MLKELQRHREMVRERIEKSFESDFNIIKAEETEEQASVTDLIKAGVLEYDDSIEKAVYADTYQNRKLGRVGQEYHRGKGKKVEEKTGKKSVNENDKTPEKKQKTEKKNSVKAAAKEFDKIVEPTNDWDDAAEKELKKRNGENQQVEKQKLKEQSTESETHSNMTIYGRQLNFNFIDSLKNKKKFSLNVLKEMGYKTQNDRQYDINATWLSNDGKSLLISFDNKYGKNEDVEIPFDSKSPTLNQLYKEYSEKVAKILDKNVPETLDKKELAEAIDIEMYNFWDNNNTHNDSQKWREQAWQIYNKYNKNNPMSIETFDRKYASAYQGASQGLKMEYYFNARAKGGSAEKAEEYANEQFNAFLRHLR
jgi:hypothetical protein